MPEKKTVWIVFKTDEWHSYDERHMLAISETKYFAVELCCQAAKKEGEELSSDDIANLHNIKQTQNYIGDGEFVIDEVELNTLL